MKTNFLSALLLAGTLAVSSGCTKDGKINVFSIEDEKTLGLQTKQQIESDPNQFPILNPSSHAAVYNYINGIKNDILNSGKVTYKDQFAWEVKVIRDDNTVNAFCTPGGYIYVYTGLIKYLNSKSALAGVMGHEIAHADKRHSTNQLTKQYGVQTLMDVVLGNNQGMLTQIASQLVSLQFSRSDETEADKYSVVYLCPTKYESDGAARFFELIEAQGGSNTPQFLSTHPNPENRIGKIKDEAITLNCNTTISNEENDAEYQQFKSMLP